MPEADTVPQRSSTIAISAGDHTEDEQLTPPPNAPPGTPPASAPTTLGGAVVIAPAAAVVITPPLTDSPQLHPASPALPLATLADTPRLVGANAVMAIVYRVLIRRGLLWRVVRPFHLAVVPHAAQRAARQQQKQRGADGEEGGAAAHPTPPLRLAVRLFRVAATAPLSPTVSPAMGPVPPARLSLAAAAAAAAAAMQPALELSSRFVVDVRIACGSGIPALDEAAMLHAALVGAMDAEGVHASFDMGDSITSAIA
jgi:hypothetical protein